MTTSQPDLFGVTVIVPHESTREERFADFCARNPWFMPRVLQLAQELRRLGARRISVKRLWEELRDEVPDQGERFRLNNSYTSLAARRLVEMDRTLRDVIEPRGRR